MTQSRQAKYNKAKRQEGVRVDVLLTPDDGEAFTTWLELKKRYGGQKPALLALLRRGE
jgi:hypothetical protein